jgi:hypothetical protein
MLVFSLLFRLLGGGFSANTNFPRWIVLLACGAVVGFNIPFGWGLLAYGYIFCIFRLLSTKPLLQATMGDANGIWKSSLKNCFALPAIFYIGNPWLVLIFFQGAIYYACGKITREGDKIPPVMLAELITGGMFGALL